MKKVLIVIILLTLSFSGCIDEKITTTTYTCGTGSEIHLMTDGTYIVDSVSDEPFYGNYTQIEEKLFLKYSVLGTDMCFKLLLNGTDYIGTDGDRWVLKTTSNDSSKI